MILSEEMIRYIENHRQEAYSPLLELVRVPAPSNYEERRVELCLNWLKSQGAGGICIDQALNVVHPADVSQDRPLDVFMTHMNVVSSDETELSLRAEDGRIYCPGVGDDTACLVCLLLVGKYITRHVDSSSWREIQGEDAPGLLLVCNAGGEGLGNLKGVRKICEDYGGRIKSFCTFDSSLSSIVDRAVDSKRFQVKICARGGHSHNDFGNDNAIAGLVSLVGESYKIQVPEGGKTTYNVGMISGGISVNTIAQEAEMLYELRSDKRESPKYMERQSMEVLDRAEAEGTDVSLQVIGVRPCEGQVDPAQKQALIDWAHRVVEEMTRQAPRRHADSTDCSIPLFLGIPSACVGNFCSAGVHTREEYAETDSLEKGYKTVLGMIFGRGD